ncbi:putative reverse transcriptase, partial [Trifolium medium]|nr:putative reverse transcriptase [Trifolium medium]
TMQALIAWKVPKPRWVSLNTEGASKNQLSAGCDGLIRDGVGVWKGGFSKNLGRCNAYVAEL